jgi:hypothetical protein
MGNPFLEESGNLLTLDSQEIADQETVRMIREAETIRHRQYEEFVQQRFRERSVSIYDPIPSNKLSLFSLPPVREHSKS